MARERRWFEGELLATQLGFIAGVLTGKSPDHRGLNPYPHPDERPPPPKTAGQLAGESAAGWGVLDNYFGG